MRLLVMLLLTCNPARLLLAQDQAAASKAETPAAAAPLEFYQLPWTLRHELPPIKITVRHAPSDPEQRFVKINGERYVQGDSLEMGPTIIEIRTDGVILEFEGQRLIIR